MPKHIKFRGNLYTQSSLGLVDYKFEELLGSVIDNAQAIKKQVQNLGGLAAATKGGHVPTVRQQLNEIASVVKTVLRRLPE